jgi:hypothetical protein
MPIRTFLDTSTAHITWADAELLVRHIESADVMQGVVLIAEAGQYGWTVSTAGMLDDAAERQDRMDAIRAAGFSDHFADLIAYAADKGAQMIRLDRDAECEPDLPTFEWTEAVTAESAKP